MQTEWLTEADQAESDKASDACTKVVDELTSTYKLECQRQARARDRVEARILAKGAARLGCEVSSLQPIRDSSGVMIGFTAPATKPAPSSPT